MFRRLDAIESEQFSIVELHFISSHVNSEIKIQDHVNSRTCRVFGGISKKREDCVTACHYANEVSLGNPRKMMTQWCCYLNVS